MALFNDPYLNILAYSLMGAVYFLIYRILFFKSLKWKMIHSIWIPILYCVTYSIFGIMLLQTPWFGANRTLLSQIGVFVELNLPVIVFIFLYTIFYFKDKRIRK